MFYASLADDMSKLPTWARAPKGKGVTEKLRKDLLEELRGTDLVSRLRRFKSWQAIVLALLDYDEALAKEKVSGVVGAHTARYSKQYTLR